MCVVCCAFFCLCPFVLGTPERVCHTINQSINQYTVIVILSGKKIAMLFTSMLQTTIQSKKKSCKVTQPNVNQMTKSGSTNYPVFGQEMRKVTLIGCSVPLTYNNYSSQYHHCFHSHIKIHWN